MAVAFMMFILELRRNGGETVISRQNFFLSFLAELDIYKTFEAILFFFNIFHLTLVIFQIFYYSTKKITSVQCKCEDNFWKKNKLGSNDSEMYNSARNGKKMAADGGFRR